MECRVRVNRHFCCLGENGGRNGSLRHALRSRDAIEAVGGHDERQTTGWVGLGIGKEAGSRSSERIEEEDEAYPSKKLRIPSLSACHGGLC